MFRYLASLAVSSAEYVPSSFLTQLINSPPDLYPERITLSGSFVSVGAVVMSSESTVSSSTFCKYGFAASALNRLLTSRSFCDTVLVAEETVLD